MSRSAIVFFVIAAAAGVSCANAFVSPPNTRIAKEQSALYFGIPTFGGKDDKEPKKDEEGEKIGVSGLIQLITAGMGSPFLGNFEGVDEETGKFLFSLEANNLVDENGQSKQTQMPYFESGWVDEADLERSANGKLMDSSFLGKTSE